MSLSAVPSGVGGPLRPQAVKGAWGQQHIQGRPSASPLLTTVSSPATTGCSDSRLDEQQRFIEYQSDQVSYLRQELDAVRECLFTSGLITKAAFDAKLHRMHFAKMCNKHPLCLDGGACLANVLCLPELALAIANGAGNPAVRALSAASHALSSATSASLPPVDILPTGNVFVCGGYDGAQFLSRVDHFDPVTLNWRPVPPMTARREAAAAAIAGGQLFVCGGFDGSRRLSAAERFDPAAGTWQQLPPMASRRVGATAVALSGKLFVCGGFNGVQYLSSVERLDLFLEAWEFVPHMSVAREGAAAAVLRQHLYVFGGNDGTQTLNAAERLDTVRGVWEPLPPMSARRDGAAAGAARGRLFVCGGFDGEHSLSSSSAERFDPGSLTWRTLRPMLARRAGAAAAVVAGQLYVCGGYDGAQNLADCERLDPTVGMWELLPAMPCRRGYAVGAAS